METTFCKEIDYLRRLLRAFYNILRQLEETKDLRNKEDSGDYYSPNIVKINKVVDIIYGDGNYYKMKIIGFEVYDGISKIYCFDDEDHIINGDEETIDNVTIINLENKSEIEFYTECWPDESAKVIRKVVTEKCREILETMLRKEG